MFDRREKNAEIFRNTELLYKTNEKLKATVEKSVEEQLLILEEDAVDVSLNTEHAGKVVVSGKRTLEASEPYAKQRKHVCVLNFASATNPGGGVAHGSSAQEESICRCSTLYPCLNQKMLWNEFYLPHRAADNPLYNDDSIFTPKVMVFKSDTNFPELLPEKEWWQVDVITCAAPNLRRVPSNSMNPCAGSNSVNISKNELRALLSKRIRRIFDVAVSSGADVLILGAFGCGAFRNPPELVAEVFAEFTEQYRKCFDVIEYAVYHTEKETANYEAFVNAMERFI